MKTFHIVILCAGLTGGMYLYFSAVIQAKNAEIARREAVIEALVNAPPDTVPGDTIRLKAEIQSADTAALEAGLRRRLLSEMESPPPDTVFLPGDTIYIGVHQDRRRDSLKYAELDTVNSHCRVWARLWLESLLWELKIDNFVKPPVVKVVEKPVYPEWELTAGSYYGGMNVYGSRVGIKWRRLGVDLYITNGGIAAGISYGVKLK